LQKVSLLSSTWLDSLTLEVSLSSSTWLDSVTWTIMQKLWGWQLGTKKQDPSGLVFK